MGQIEVYEWLKKQRMTGDDRYWRPKEIERGMHDAGYDQCRRSSLMRNCNMLYQYGYLEIKMTGKFSDWQRMFRVKSQYLKT